MGSIQITANVVIWGFRDTLTKFRSQYKRKLFGQLHKKILSQERVYKVNKVFKNL